MEGDSIAFWAEVARGALFRLSNIAIRVVDPDVPGRPSGADTTSIVIEY